MGDTGSEEESRLVATVALYVRAADVLWFTLLSVLVLFTIRPPAESRIDVSKMVVFMLQ
jgi:hypothetical protein